MFCHLNLNFLPHHNNASERRHSPHQTLVVLLTWYPGRELKWPPQDPSPELAPQPADFILDDPDIGVVNCKGEASLGVESGGSPSLLMIQACALLSRVTYPFSSRSSLISSEPYSNTFFRFLSVLPDKVINGFLFSSEHSSAPEGCAWKEDAN
jgi:hypothetical protein